ncbi:MAG: mannose-6-phosphate isomerase-like protein (cupin superfamily) [Gammaproteobacteria bacterium]|jgi:mannose-6-phosphate isomerase-like protein (cupin superfamily)
MEKHKLATCIKLGDALQMGPAPEGNLAIPVLKHGSMEAELYLPKGRDPQKPHSRDEIYLVTKGHGEFFDGEKNHSVEPGSFINVPAGVEHRFENFTDDLTVWVIFYGPECGEIHQD